jgi:hypothetical protein
MKPNRKVIVPLVLSIIIGIHLFTDERINTIRSVDIVQLIAFGALIGTLITALFQQRKESLDD